MLNSRTIYLAIVTFSVIICSVTSILTPEAHKQHLDITRKYGLLSQNYQNKVIESAQSEPSAEYQTFSNTAWDTAVASAKVLVLSRDLNSLRQQADVAGKSYTERRGKYGLEQGSEESAESGDLATAPAGAVCVYGVLTREREKPHDDPLLDTADYVNNQANALVAQIIASVPFNDVPAARGEIERARENFKYFNSQSIRHAGVMAIRRMGTPPYNAHEDLFDAALTATKAARKIEVVDLFIDHTCGVAISIEAHAKRAIDSNA